MRILPKEAWRYTALLILLFCIAGIAVWQVLQFLADRLVDTDFRVAALLVWAVTMGFLLIAGAFGLWAIRFSSEGESRRRIARLVDAMYYIDDAVLAIDKRGRVRGSNPAVTSVTGTAATDEVNVRALFPCLTADDLSLISDKFPQEIEHQMVTPEGIRVLRFRSQPSGGLILLLISDVTAMNEVRTRRRQSAQLQLIGELARAVAHDFDGILCAISGHAALLGRLPAESKEAVQSRETIAAEAERGVVLAGHLKQLASTPIGQPLTSHLDTHVATAASALDEMLPNAWTVTCSGDGAVDTVGLTGLQLEQIIQQLGLSIVESSPGGHVIDICVTPPVTAANASSRFAVSVLLVCRSSADIDGDHTELHPQTRDEGLIVSVVRTLLLEAGGVLDALETDEGLPAFRANLPRGQSTTGTEYDVPDEIRAYVADWTVLCAGTAEWRPAVPQLLGRIHVDVRKADDVTTALAAIEQDRHLDVAVFHARLLGQEPAGLLRAILKIRTDLGIVVVTDNPDVIRTSLNRDVVCMTPDGKEGQIVTALVEAKGLAVRRKTTTNA